MSAKTNLVRPAMVIRTDGEAGHTDDTDDDDLNFTVAKVSAPVVGLEPVQEITDGISYVGMEKIDAKWHSYGNVGGYVVAITDSAGETMVRKETAKESLSLDAGKNLLQGEIYTLTVTAVPEGGTEADDETASVRFALYIEGTVAAPTPTPEPPEPVTAADQY